MSVSKIAKTASTFLGIYLILTFMIGAVVLTAPSLGYTVDVVIIGKIISFTAILTVLSIILVCATDPEVYY